MDNLNITGWDRLPGVTVLDLLQNIYHSNNLVNACLVILLRELMAGQFRT